MRILIVLDAPVPPLMARIFLSRARIFCVAVVRPNIFLSRVYALFGVFAVFSVRDTIRIPGRDYDLLWFGPGWYLVNNVLQVLFCLFSHRFGGLLTAFAVY